MRHKRPLYEEGPQRYENKGAHREQSAGFCTVPTATNTHIGKITDFYEYEEKSGSKSIENNLLFMFKLLRVQNTSFRSYMTIKHTSHLRLYIHRKDTDSCSNMSRHC